MTSPQLIPQPSVAGRQSRRNNFTRIGVPLLLLLTTLLTTTSVGMRYMYNFQLGKAPLNGDADILPYPWVLHHLGSLASGLPFSITLIAILLAHEFGHYFACRRFSVRATYPYMLPAPSLSGTFGAVIRLKSRVPSRAALMVIGAAGPIAGFVVAIGTVTAGLLLSHYGTTAPTGRMVQAPLLFELLHLVTAPASALHTIVPHPVLSASWIGILITALNLIPAGQLDGGHIVYALSPRAHRWTSGAAVVVLLLVGLKFWIGWILWGLILLTPGMRHPKIGKKDVRDDGLTTGQKLLAPICLVILVLSAMYQPFTGYDLVHVVRHFHAGAGGKSARG